MTLNVTYKSIFLVLGICAIFFKIRPYERGFNCNDESIQKPFNNIFYLTKLLFTVAIAIPLIIILIVEKLKNGTISTSVLRSMAKFWFGFFVNLALNEITKKMIGRLRPHTYQLCNLQRYCPRGSVDEYISSFECEQSLHYYYSINTRLSFFSGHSAIGSFSGTYIVLYLHETIFRNFLRSSTLRKSLIIIVDILVMLFYLYPGFTQYQIYWHFASDVLTGHSIGILVAYTIMCSINK